MASHSARRHRLLPLVVAAAMSVPATGANAAVAKRTTKTKSTSTAIKKRIAKPRSATTTIPVATAPTTTVPVTTIPGAAVPAEVTTTVAPTTLPTTIPSSTIAAPLKAVEWGPCPVGNLDCANIAVPLNPKEPTSGQITLFVSRRKASGPSPRLGVLFVNPGGPGGPAYDLVRSAGTFLTPEMLSRYDVLGIDPRGTSRSSALRCGVTRRFGAQDDKEFYDAYASACGQSDGDRLQYFDTETAARDLDAVRAALGEEKISYLGMSYGTYLGAVYRSLFPSRVKSMVLDSAIDPNVFGVNQLLDRITATDIALDGFLDECASGRLSPCNFNDGTDLRTKYVRIREDYIVKSGRNRATAEETFDRNVAELVGYPRNGWPILGRALQELAAGGRANFNQTAADSKSTDDSERVVPVDTFSTSTNFAINCRDGLLPRDPSAAQFIAEQAPIRAPRFSGLRSDATFAYTCVNWPAPVAAPVPLGPQPAPTLVIGNTFDLTTPYKWSQGLATTLGAPLLTRNGGGHVAVTKSPCVKEAVARFMIDNISPVTGTVCSPSLSNPS